jgi:hypothetical protein
MDDGNDTSADRYFRSFEPSRITTSVVLMVRAREDLKKRRGPDTKAVLKNVSKPPRRLGQPVGTEFSRRTTNQTSAAKDELELSPKKRAARTESWARLIKRVYQAGPLKCDCEGKLRVIAFITEPVTTSHTLLYSTEHEVIRKILELLQNHEADLRAPPES